MARGRDKNHKSSRGRGASRGGRSRSAGRGAAAQQRSSSGGGNGKFARRVLDQGARHRAYSDEDGATSTTERGTWAVDGSAPPMSNEANELEAEDGSAQSAVIDFGLLAQQLSTLDDATLLMVSEARAEALVGTANVRRARAAVHSSLPRAPRSLAPATRLSTRGAPAQPPSDAVPPPSVASGHARRAVVSGTAAVAPPSVRAPQAGATAAPPAPPLAPAPVINDDALSPAAVTSGDLDALLALPLGSPGAPQLRTAPAAAPFDLEALLAL